MTILFRIDKEEGRTLVLWGDVVTADESLAHVGRLCAHADWPPPSRLHLADLRNSSLDASMDGTTLEKAAALYGEHRDKIARMRAGIVSGEAFWRAVEFERLFSRYGATVIVFGFLSPACTWLGMSCEEVEQKFQQMPAELRGRTTLSEGSP